MGKRQGKQCAGCKRTDLPWRWTLCPECLDYYGTDRELWPEWLLKQARSINNEINRSRRHRELALRGNEQQEYEAPIKKFYIPINLKVDSNLYDRLYRMARVLQCGVSYLTREALDIYIEGFEDFKRNAPDDEWQQFKQRDRGRTKRSYGSTGGQWF